MVVIVRVERTNKQTTKQINRQTKKTNYSMQEECANYDRHSSRRSTQKKECWF